VQKPALRSVCLFHATAESEYLDIRRVGFRQPVAIIPNGIDIPTLLPRSPSESRKLLFLGRIHPNKGLDMLLPAWKIVENRFKDWRLIVIGPDEGGYLSQMQRLAYDLSIERIEFGGPSFGSGKWQAYMDSDLFILPSYSENFGMTVAEALASSIPAIVAKGAPWSGLETNGAGWWIDIGVDPLVACLEEAMTQPRERLYSMGSRGREWMQSEFSWVGVASRMQDTYRWILGGGSKPNWIIEN
jgi:glycosyltransferase involved in cell wall biosynthesis